MPNFFEEEKYALHYKNLQLYLGLGLKLKKIHHILEFNQAQWLNPYVKFKTQNRIEAKTNGYNNGKELYKSMDNAVYGKTIKNLN